MLAATPIETELSLATPSIQQIGMAVLLALLLHILVLLAFYLAPSAPPPAPQLTIEVSLEAAASKSAQVADQRPAAPNPPPRIAETPVAQPVQAVPAEISKNETPAVPNVAAPTVPTHITQPTPTHAVEQSNAAPAEEIQPLFRLTRMPSFSKKVEAAYPPAERRAGTQSSVLAEVTIDSAGNVIAVRILKSGGSTFDEAVKQALQKSLFSPGMINDQPVGTRFQVPFRFNLS